MKNLLALIVISCCLTSNAQTYIKSSIVGSYTLGACNNSVVIEGYNLPQGTTLLYNLTSFYPDTVQVGDVVNNLCLYEIGLANDEYMNFGTSNGYIGHVGALHSNPVIPDFEFDVSNYVEPTGGYYDALTYDGSLTLEFDSAYVLGTNYTLVAFQDQGNVTDISYPTSNTVTLDSLSHGWMTFYLQNDLVPEEFLDIRFYYGDAYEIYKNTGLDVELSMQHADSNCVGWVNATPVNATGNLYNVWDNEVYNQNTQFGLCPGLYSVYSYETDSQTAMYAAGSIDTFIVTNTNTAYIDSSIYQYAAQDTSYYNFENCLFDFTAPIDTLTYVEDTVFQGGGITVITFEMNLYQDSTFITITDSLVLLNDSLIHLDVAIWCDSTLGSNKALSFNGRRVVFLRGVEEHSFSQGTASLTEESQPFSGCFPNPANESLTVYIENVDEAELKLVNPNGQLIYQTQMHSNTIDLDIQSLPTGLYFIEVSNDDWVSRMKFQKQ